MHGSHVQGRLVEDIGQSGNVLEPPGGDDRGMLFNWLGELIS